VWLRRGAAGGGHHGGICLAFTGSLYLQALDAARRLKAAGHEPDLYNLRFLKPVDEEYLVEQLNNYNLVVFIEEGVRCGGFGEYAAALPGWGRPRTGGCAKTAVLAVEEDFSADGRAIGTGDELLRNNQLDGAGIAQRILGMIV
jgi:1-deoxy-D-xylulose-5-phosphate synthase